MVWLSDTAEPTMCGCRPDWITPLMTAYTTMTTTAFCQPFARSARITGGMMPIQ